LLPRLPDSPRSFVFWDRESFFENVLWQLYPSYYFVKPVYLRVFEQVYLALTSEIDLALRLQALSQGQQFPNPVCPIH
jgi:hypothetical protein